MSIAVRPHPSLSSWGRRTIASHPVIAFLMMVYAVNIAVALSPALTRRDLLPFDQAPYDWIGHTLGVALPAFIVVAALRGRDGVRDLARRCLRWQVGLRWYVVALLGMPIATMLLAFLFYGMAPLQLLADKWSLLFTLVLPHLALVIIFSNLAEEIGWTGFLFDRMQERYSPLKASFVVAIPFALFHVPGYVVEATSFGEVLLFAAVLFIPQFASRVIVAWLYNNTARSLLIVGLFHCSFNVTSSDIAGEFTPAPAGDIFVLTSGFVILAAIVIAAVTKGRLSYGTPRESE
ncbi:MAG: CPBP family intramembrane glutamic endopeptidase [Actinomycetota bacterium]